MCLYIQNLLLIYLSFKMKSVVLSVTIFILDEATDSERFKNKNRVIRLISCRAEIQRGSVFMFLVL